MGTEEKKKPVRQSKPNQRNSESQHSRNSHQGAKSNRSSSGGSGKHSQHKHHRHRSDNKKISIPGKILAVVELAVSAIFYGFLWNTGMVPGKYLAVLGIFLLVLFGVCFGLEFTKKKFCLVIGIVFSIGLSLLFGMGAYYVSQMNSAMEQVGGATYKTDNMVVVVKKDDEAETLLDAKEYKFGYQTTADQNNTNLMVQKINTVLGNEPSMTEYETMEELANALLDGEIDAAIYNEAFNAMVADSIQDYESKIRILYQYGIDTELEEAEKKNVREPFSVYISGIDVYGPITTNSRSDVNIIMTVNPETKQILLATTPRDYYVEIPGISGGQKDKLTHAGIYGVDKSMDTLEALYGIEINYYARVNFSSLIKIIDVLGGVDVNSEYAFSAGGYSYKQGVNHLNGQQALAFSRERHSFASGDNQRGKNQEAVITAILQKAMSPAILTNANSLIASVSDSLETNMTKDEMSDLIRMQLDDGSAWNIVSVNAVGTGDSQACFSSGRQLLYVMQPNMVSVSEISTKMNQVINGETVTE